MLCNVMVCNGLQSNNSMKHNLTEHSHDLGQWTLWTEINH